MSKNVEHEKQTQTVGHPDLGIWILPTPVTIVQPMQSALPQHTDRHHDGLTSEPPLG